MINTDNNASTSGDALSALRAENEKLKSDLGIQKNLTKQACFEANRAYDEVEKWKKMFYDLWDKQASVSTDPKVLVTASGPADGEGDVTDNDSQPMYNGVPPWAR